MMEEKGSFAKAGGLIDDSILKISNFLGPCLVGAAAGFISSYKPILAENSGYITKFLYLTSCPWMWVVIGVGISIFGIVGTDRFEKRQKQTIEELKKKEEKLTRTERALDLSYEQIEGCESRLRELQSELVTSALKSAFRSLEMTTHDRISLYYESDDDFYLLSRYSQNPELCKNHRQKFSINQGVISKAWQHRIHIEEACPPAANSDSYEAYMAEVYSYDAETTQAFAMKSCRYVGYAITDADAPIGVLIFESINPDFFTGGRLSKLDRIKQYCGEYQSHFSKYVRTGISLSRETRKKPSRAAELLEQDILEQIREAK